MSEPVTGVCIVKVDGISVRAKEGAKLMLGGFERTAQYADGGLVGHSRRPIASRVTATLVHTSVLDLIALRETDNATIQFVTDTGVTYVIRGATVITPPELTGGEGDVDMEFEGQPATQL